MKILIATNNSGKKRELLEFFSCDERSKKFEFSGLEKFESPNKKNPEPQETGKNFEENALIKAKFYAKKYKIPSLADDSGLMLEAFPEKFGLRTRREISANSDEEWLEKFLKILEGQKNRNANFISAMAFFDPNKNIEKIFLGKISGVITKKQESEIEQGIPVSSVFLPFGQKKVFSSMKKEEKNKISHRGQAAKKIIHWLSKNF